MRLRSLALQASQLHFLRLCKTILNDNAALRLH